MDLLHSRRYVTYPHAATNAKRARCLGMPITTGEDAEGTQHWWSPRRLESTALRMVKFLLKTRLNLRNCVSICQGSCGVHSKHYDSDMPTTQELTAWAQSYGVRINFHHVVGGMGYQPQSLAYSERHAPRAEALQQAIHESVVYCSSPSARTPSWKEEHYGS